MKINWKIVSALLAAGLVYDGYVSNKNSKLMRRMNDYNAYLAQMLNKAGVEPDEYDLIILETLSEGLDRN